MRLRSRLLAAVAVQLSFGTAAALASDPPPPFWFANNTFEIGQSPSNSSDIAGWYNALPADPGQWWLGAWQGPAASFNGTSVMGLSGAPGVDAWAYQRVRLRWGPSTTAFFKFDVGSFTDTGEVRDLGVRIDFFKANGTFQPADGLDILNAPGVQLIDTFSYNTGPIAHGESRRVDASLSIVGVSPTDELYMRFSNFVGDSGVGQAWTMIDNIGGSSPGHFPGDANRDEQVDFDDLLILANSYGAAQGQYWERGDFNYDGDVDFDDLLVIATYYGFGTISTVNSAAFDADWTHAQSVVPEPTTTFTMLAIAGGLTRRRRSLR